MVQGYNSSIMGKFDDTGFLDEDTGFLDDTGLIDDTSFLDETENLADLRDQLAQEDWLDDENEPMEVYSEGQAPKEEAEGFLDDEEAEDNGLMMTGVIDVTDTPDLLWDDSGEEILICEAVPSSHENIYEKEEEPVPEGMDPSLYEEPDREPPETFGDRIANMSILDYVMLFAAAAILVILGMATVRFATMRQMQEATESLAAIGSQLDGVNLAGSENIAAIRDARIIRDAENAAKEQAKEEQDELISNVGTIPVDMTLSTIQSDLKIKIHNKNDKSLISGTPFKVIVTLPSGVQKEYEDDDQDGIIYKNQLGSGTYKVKLEQLVDEKEQKKVSEKDGDATIELSDTYKKYSKYLISNEEQTIDITDKIAYKAVDVADEVKKESQVNVAAEDTQKKQAVESAVKDTVEWVESSKTEEDAQYEEISKDTIPSPTTGARALPLKKPGTTVVRDDFHVLGEQNDEENEEETSEEQEENKEEEQKTEETSSEKRSYTTNIKGNTSVSQGASTMITASTDEPGATEYSWEVDGDAIEIDKTSGKTVKVTGKSQGEATLICTARIVAEDADPKENVVRTKITVTEEENADHISLHVTPSSLTLATGKSQKLSVEVSGTEEKGVAFESAEPMIASVDSEGNVKADVVGETRITITSQADNSIKQDVTVKVVQAGTNESGTTLLLDKNGNQVYVKENGTYREATVEDYDKFDKFYIKSTPKDTGFKYTGWQNIGGKTYYFNMAGEPVTGTQVINGATYNFDSNGVLQTGSSKVGIDVSTWNGSINWQQVASSGISYAIVRCGYRGSSSGALIADSTFGTNASGARAAGLKVGVYVFSQAINEAEAVEEASMAIAQASGYGISLPIFIDIEGAGGRADGISVAQRTAVAAAFCQTVRNAGYQAGIYSNASWLTHSINTPALTGYTIWMAHYTQVPTYSRTRYDIWQYSSKGRVNGISGDVDMNIMY